MSTIDNIVEALSGKKDEKDIFIFSQTYDVQKEVTEATINTLTNKLGAASSIAYLDKGAELYERFKKTTLENNDPSKSESARLISTYKDSLCKEIKDVSRLIVIGGGSFESLYNQELALVSGLYAGGTKPPLQEIVLIDVSREFLSEGVQAVQKFEAEHNTKLDIKLIQSDFKKIAKSFDTIMTEGFGSKSINDTHAAIILTGGTFGNIEGIAATDRFPGAEIDKQMAYIADYVGKGSIAMFDYFTKIETGVNYYSKNQLSEFFNNIPRIMQKYCKNLEGLYSNPENQELFFRYRARALPSARMIAHELVAETNQSPKIVNGIERLFPINQNDTLTMMFSLRAHASDIYNRPYQNTGLLSSSYVSNGDLVMHSFRKVGIPGATHQPEIEYSRPVEKAFSDNLTAPRMKDSVSAFISRFEQPSMAPSPA